MTKLSHRIYVLHFLYLSSTNSHQGCFYSLALTNTPALNVLCRHVTHTDFISSGYVPGSGIAESHSSQFKGLRNFLAVFVGDLLVCFFTNSVQGFLLVHILIVIFSLFANHYSF